MLDHPAVIDLVILGGGGGGGVQWYCDEASGKQGYIFIVQLLKLLVVSGPSRKPSG